MGPTARGIAALAILLPLLYFVAPRNAAVDSATLDGATLAGALKISSASLASPAPTSVVASGLSGNALSPAVPANTRVAQQVAGSPTAPSKEFLGIEAAQRSDTGLTVSGASRGLPVGTKLWVEIVQQPNHARVRGEGPMDSNVIINGDGSFLARIAAPSGIIFAAGKYGIRITSFFTSGWQDLQVLKEAGVGDLDASGRSDVHTNPRAIRQSPDFIPDDPEFPKATRHLEAIREVTLGPLGADQAAIGAVKAATLVVTGSGRSSMSVGKSVDFFAAAPGFKPLAWSAAGQTSGKWIVTLNCVDGEAQKTAQWEYDATSKAVKYLDPLAKTLSYVPAN
jgi:hypothetical protein